MRSVIDKYAGMPFDYRSDCCRFAAECVEMVTGKNPIAELSYSTEREAYRIIKQYGGLREAVTHYLGEPSDGEGKDGDVCLIDASNNREALGVIYRDRVVARVESGLMDYPVSRAKTLWSL